MLRGRMHCAQIAGRAPQNLGQEGRKGLLLIILPLKSLKYFLYKFTYLGAQPPG